MLIKSYDLMNESSIKKRLYKISKAYYEDNMTQQQIAKRFGLSRVMVSRLLNRALEEGVVQIKIIAPDTPHTKLEDQLEAKYDLHEVVIAKTSGVEDIYNLEQVGHIAASYLSSIINDNDLIAISWGKSLYHVINALPPDNCPKSKIVQMLGGIGEPESGAHGSHIARKMAQQLSAIPRLVHAPAIVKNKNIREGLLDDPQIIDTLNLVQKAKYAIVGIGAYNQNALLYKDDTILDINTKKELIERGAIGDIALRFFDSKGESINSSLDERLISVTMDVIRNIPKVIGVAAGSRKSDAVHAALKGSLIDVLIIDDQLAYELINR
jgi:DNA-binding transcriptional regulator LsrR (DeoR family)